MKVANWDHYQLLDTSCGERLERWNDIILIRPDPQIIWRTEKKSPLWKKANARYVRSKKGGGAWEAYTKIPDQWRLSYKNLTFGIKPMGFKHTGVFPEQAANWDLQSNIIKNSPEQLDVLNLFAYTGGATLACAAAGARVCHVDASKGMTSWAKENSQISSLSQKPIRWIVDDCVKFVQKEIRRGKKYQGIIMDPPSYGRGPGGEIWKLEEQLFDLVQICLPLLDNRSKFFMLNSYTTGLSASVMEYLLADTLIKPLGGTVSSYELGLKVLQTGFNFPCGSTAVWLS